MKTKEVTGADDRTLTDDLSITKGLSFVYVVVKYRWFGGVPGVGLCSSLCSTLRCRFFRSEVSISLVRVQILPPCLVARHLSLHSHLTASPGEDYARKQIPWLPTQPARV